MDMQFKIPVTSFYILVEHEFRACQPFAVLTAGRVFVTGKLVYGLELPRKGKKSLNDVSCSFLPLCILVSLSYSFAVW